MSNIRRMFTAGCVSCIFLAGALNLWMSSAKAQTAPATAASTQASAATEFDHYTLVMLVLSDEAPRLTEDEAADLQRRHLAHIAALGETKQLLVAGPFGDRDDEAYRGVLLFSGSIDEARTLCERDPAVIAGRLRVVCQTWYVQKGSLAFPRLESAATQPALR